MVPGESDPMYPFPTEAVVLLSGGLDSAVVLSILDTCGVCKRIEAVSFNYGQKHAEAELMRAAMIADYYNVQHTVMDLRGANIFSHSPRIKISGEEVPLSQDPNRGVVAPTYVPRRNTVLLSIAAAYAEQRGIGTITAGMHKTDSAYPDCTLEYVNAFHRMLAAGSPQGKPMHLYTPIILMDKRSVVIAGIANNAPLYLTSSCYQGHIPACGRCDTCQIRIAAFKEAGYVDPIDYEIDIDWDNASRDLLQEA